MVSQLIIQTLLAMGVDVVDLDLSTTPTVEIAVPLERAQGGIIVTASHNPAQWNALKFLNADGEFISAADGAAILAFIKTGDMAFAELDDLGSYSRNDNYIDIHVEQILALESVRTEVIRDQKFKVVVDCINSTGALLMPALLKALNCQVILLNEEITGDFAHNPEPRPEHLTDLCQAVKDHQADMGVAVDPDVDRLAFVDNTGTFYGEEYTLVTVADYLLKEKPGSHTVSNMSSTGALRIVTEKHGGTYSSSAVGEVNVVNEMKYKNALIGGEGNGGVIYPALHYGRDAAVGVALVLSYMATENISLSALRATYPDLHIAKHKIELTPGMDVDGILDKIRQENENLNPDSRDGLKFVMGDTWVQMRKSNTEPIIRVYAESHSEKAADHLAFEWIDKIKKYI